MGNLPAALVADPAAQQNFEYLSGLVAPPIVAALPPRPFDGQVVRFRPVSGVIWELAFDKTITDGKPWVVLGGRPLRDTVLTQESLANNGTTFVDLTTVGPQVTMPLAAVVDYGFSCYFQCATAGIGGYATVKNGANAAVASDGMLGDHAGFGPLVREVGTFPAVAANAVLKMQYRQVGASATVTAFGYRELWAMPRRVG